MSLQELQKKKISKGKDSFFAQFLLLKEQNTQ